MGPGPEGWLVLLVVALFLKDSLLLLRTEEAVLVRAAGGRWRAGFGARSWRLAGKEPHLLNPFLPHEPVVRLAWSLSGATGSRVDGPPRAVAVPDAIVGLWPWAWATWSILFALLPATLLSTVPHVTVPMAAGLLYLSIVASLLAVWRRRRAIGTTSKAFWMLAFECLACPPYSANLLRKVSMQLAPTEEFGHAAARLLDADRLQAACREVRARIDEALESEDADSAAAVALRRGRERFGKEADGHE